MPSGYTFDSSHGPGVGMSSSGSSGSGRSYTSSSSGSSISNAVNKLVSSVSNAASTNTSMLGDRIREFLGNPSTSARMANLYDGYVNDYGLAFDMDEYYDKLLEMADYNNQWSANQAQKAMDFEASQADKMMQYQTRSDQAAMAWSAKEAQKSRDWTQNLSDTAHQREIKDLMAAGLNPILSANGGAWSGSGATGQGFSSSGAMASGSMGATDMSASAVFGNMVSGMMTTARDLAITRMNTEANKYATDKQFAAAKMAAETSIFNNNNNIDANKAIRALDRDADIQKAGIQASATRDAAAAGAGAVMSAAAMQSNAAKYSADRHYESAEQTAGATRYQANRSYQSTKYRADTDYDIQKLKNESNILSNPVGYLDYMDDTKLGKTIQEVVNGYQQLERLFPNVHQPHEIGDWLK